MPTKRKISVRKIMRVFVTITVTCACIISILGASKMQQKEYINSIQLHVRNDQYQFLDKDALMKEVVEKKKIKIHKTTLAQLDIKGVEKIALDNPWISEAQAYLDNSRNLHLYVTQRIPVARIFYENGQSLYLNGTLNVLPLSDFFTYYTTIVTNVPNSKNDSINRSIRGKIISMVKFIERDTFWSAQIAQISMTPDLKFELTPTLGTHKILFGDTIQMKTKFIRLFVFYKNVLNRIGWDRYDLLDLRFQDQVVASPSVPWKPPSQNAISNMDWVDNIIGDMAKDEPKTTVNKTESKPVAALKKQPIQTKKTDKKIKAIKEVAQEKVIVNKQEDNNQQENNNH